MSRAAPAFRYFARRKAFANRYRPPDPGAAPPGGRLLAGVCEKCGCRHRQPDLRYRCPQCGDSFCLAEATAVGRVCRCGGELEAAGAALARTGEPQP